MPPWRERALLLGLADPGDDPDGQNNARCNSRTGAGGKQKTGEDRQRRKLAPPRRGETVGDLYCGCDRMTLLPEEKHQD